MKRTSLLKLLLRPSLLVSLMRCTDCNTSVSVRVSRSSLMAVRYFVMTREDVIIA